MKREGEKNNKEEIEWEKKKRGKRGREIKREKERTKKKANNVTADEML